MSHRKMEEGQEFTDGLYNYLAYRKDDGRVVLRDVEGFDYSHPSVDMLDEDLSEVDADVPAADKVARWEAAHGDLPRGA